MDKGKRRPSIKTKFLNVITVNTGAGKYEFKNSSKKCNHKCLNKTKFVR